MVYVIQEQPGKNILPCMKFGKVEVLLPPGMQIGFSAGQVTEQLRVKLSNFKDEDYLVLIGDPIIIGIAVAVACFWNKGKANLLKWDRQEHIYYPVAINIYEKGLDDGTKSTFC